MMAANSAKHTVPALRACPPTTRSRRPGGAHLLGSRGRHRSTSPVAHRAGSNRLHAPRRLAEAGCTTHQIAAVTGHKTLDEVQWYTSAANRMNLADEATRKIGANGTGTEIV
jgi:hypothetical protein